MFRSGAEVEKACAVQIWRRTAASASEKVTAGLAYHAARLGRMRPRAARSLAAERHQREQGEQARGGAGDGEVRPLALGFHPEMAAHLGERHLDGPAADEAAQHVEGVGGLVCAYERLRLELTGDVSDQQPADRHLLAWVIPERRARDDVEPALAPPIPACHRDALPRRLRVGQTPEQRRLARAGHARAALCPRPARGRRVEQARVEPQPGDHGHMPLHGGEQLDGGVAAVCDGDDLPVGQPACEQEQQLPRTVGQRLVPASPLLGVAFRRRQRRQERQGPDPPGERHGCEQHQADPAQARRLDEVAAAGAHGVAVDAARLDPGAPAALDGLVDADHDRSVRHKGGDQQAEQAARRSPA